MRLAAASTWGVNWTEWARAEASGTFGVPTPLLSALWAISRTGATSGIKSEHQKGAKNISAPRDDVKEGHRDERAFDIELKCGEIGGGSVTVSAATLDLRFPRASDLRRW